MRQNRKHIYVRPEEASMLVLGQKDLYFLIRALQPVWNLASSVYKFKNTHRIRKLVKRIIAVKPDKDNAQ